MNSDLFSSPGVQSKYKMLLGQWLYEKEDLLMRDLMSSNIVFQNATAGLASDNPTEITRNDINNIEKMLLNGNAKTVMSSVTATQQIGTAPVRDAFVAMCNTAIVSDLQNVSGVVLKAQYPGVNPGDFKPEEYCSVSRFRFFVSSEGIEESAASLNGNTVYKIPMTGVEAIGKIGQTGYTAKVGIIPNYAMSTVAQNYGMYAKFAIARAIQNQNWASGLCVTVRL